MLYKALISFGGKESMTLDEVKEIKDQAIVDDLLKAGYIEAVKSEPKAEPKKEKKKTPVKEG